MSGIGYITATVWPPYIGLSDGDPGPPGGIAEGEPFEDINYQRGQIFWRTEDGHTLGSAQVYVPKGVYTHIVFFSGPHRIHPLMGANRLEQPAVFEAPIIIEIDPIHNDEYLPRGM